MDLAGRLPVAVVESYYLRRIDAFHRRMAAVRPGYGGRDEFDEVSHLVLATDGRGCVGGLRLTVRGPDRPALLPMEKECAGLDLVAMFPELPLAGSPHAELSRMVIGAIEQPTGYSNTVAERLFEFLWGRGNPRPDVRYVFSLSSRLHQRLFRALARLNGVDCVERPLPAALQPGVVTPGSEFSVQAYLRR